MGLGILVPSRNTRAAPLVPRPRAADRPAVDADDDRALQRAGRRVAAVDPVLRPSITSHRSETTYRFRRSRSTAATAGDYLTWVRDPSGDANSVARSQQSGSRGSTGSRPATRNLETSRAGGSLAAAADRVPAIKAELRFGMNSGVASGANGAARGRLPLGSLVPASKRLVLSPL